MINTASITNKTICQVLTIVLLYSMKSKNIVTSNRKIGKTKAGILQVILQAY